MKERIKQAMEKSLQGKWERTGEGWFNVPDCAKIVVKDEWGQTYIASVYAGQHQEANAHLIANAPEWLRWQNERIEQLEKALEFYASYWNHEVQLEDIGMTSVQRDGGRIARQALGKEE